MMKRMIPILAVLALLAARCGSSSERIGTDTSVPDSPPDTAVDTADPPADTPADTLPDETSPDVEPDSGPCTAAPPCPEGPEDGVLGRACLGDGACDEVEEGMCWGETNDLYEGEVYTQNPGGTCMSVTAGRSACDPEDDSGCPPGGRCVPTGWEGMGGEWSYCIDACTPADTSGEPYDWACGCRMGYRCDINNRMCLSGCSNDRECCETWLDANRNGHRETGEVTFWAECTSFCDGDDDDERAGCMATYDCINPGTPTALFGDPCEHDYQCPVDGTCWRWPDEEGVIYPPGGYCTRQGCHLSGRGCEDASGACINSGSLTEPAGICIRPCHVGRDITDSDYECRTTPGEEQACIPISSWAWIGGAPAGGEDGYCFPGNFGTGTGALGDDCTDAGECASPYGLGECTEWFGDVPFCSIRCNESLAVDEAICGPAGTGGVAEGICGWTMCWAGCDTPGGALGANGCTRTDFACAPLSLFDSTTWVAAGASRPPGFCLPACDSDSFCEDTFGPGSTCDTASGVCS